MTRGNGLLFPPPMSEYYRRDNSNRPFATNEHLIAWQTAGLDDKAAADAAAWNDIARCLAQFNFASGAAIRTEAVRPASEFLAALLRAKDVLDLLCETNTGRSGGMKRVADQFPNTLTQIRNVYAKSNDVDRMKAALELCRNQGGGFANFIERARGLDNLSDDQRKLLVGVLHHYNKLRTAISS